MKVVVVVAIKTTSFTYKINDSIFFRQFICTNRILENSVYVFIQYR